jgi:hypothetical protein
MEGVKILSAGADALDDLKKTLEGLIQYLYPGKEYRFLDDYFPFTEPSLQIEVLQNKEWMEDIGSRCNTSSNSKKLQYRRYRLGFWIRSGSFATFLL